MYVCKAATTDPDSFNNFHCKTGSIQEEMAAAAQQKQQQQQRARALSRPCRRLGLLSLRERRWAEAAGLRFAKVNTYIGFIKNNNNKR